MHTMMLSTPAVGADKIQDLKIGDMIMAGFMNSCHRCGADVTNEFYSAFQFGGKVCAACMRIEQQNKEMKKILDDDRRERAYQERPYTPTPEKPEVILKRILSSRGETAHGENPNESMISMFFKEPLVKFFFWFFVVIFILAAIGKSSGS